jgi:hypothetical protein
VGALISILGQLLLAVQTTHANHRPLPSLLQQQQPKKRLLTAEELPPAPPLQALHFGTWVWSLQHTSLAHSLLLVSTTPIILVAYSLISRQAISAGEVAGAVMAVAGKRNQQQQQQQLCQSP